jgi:hypothetical protein
MHALSTEFCGISKARARWPRILLSRGRRPLPSQTFCNNSEAAADVRMSNPTPVEPRYILPPARSPASKLPPPRLLILLISSDFLLPQRIEMLIGPNPAPQESPQKPFCNCKISESLSLYTLETAFSDNGSKADVQEDGIQMDTLILEAYHEVYNETPSYQASLTQEPLCSLCLHSWR